MKCNYERRINDEKYCTHKDVVNEGIRLQKCGELINSGMCPHRKTLEKWILWE